MEEEQNVNASLDSLSRKPFSTCLPSQIICAKLNAIDHRCI